MVNPEETATPAPATTAAPLTWETFMGAEYYMGSQAGLTWQQARDKCKVSLTILDSEWIENILANV